MTEQELKEHQSNLEKILERTKTCTDETRIYWLRYNAEMVLTILKLQEPSPERDDEISILMEESLAWGDGYGYNGEKLTQTP